MSEAPLYATPTEAVSGQDLGRGTPSSPASSEIHLFMNTDTAALKAPPQRLSERGLQGYLAHKKTPNLLGPP